MFIEKFSKICAHLNAIIILGLIMAILFKHDAKPGINSVNTLQNDFILKIVLIEDFTKDNLKENLKHFYQNNKSTILPKNLFENFFKVNNKTVEEVLSQNEKLLITNSSDNDLILKIILLRHKLHKNYSKYIKSYSENIDTKDNDYFINILKTTKIKPDTKIINENINAIQQNLNNLWYQNELVLLMLNNDTNSPFYSSFKDLLNHKIIENLSLLFTLIVFVFLATIIGIITILVYLSNLKPNSHKLDSPATSILSGFDLLVIFEIFFASQILLSTIVKWFNQFVNYSESALSVAYESFFVYFLLSLITLLFIYFLAKQYDKNIFDVIYLKFKTPHNSTIKLITKGFLGWCCCLPVLISLNIILKYFKLSGVSTNPVLMGMHEATGQSNVLALTLLFLLTAILAPIYEEILFRGILFNYLKSKKSLLYAIIVSTASFAFIHIDPNVFWQLFTLGLCFAILTDKYESILPSIVTHSLWNGITMVSIFIIYS